MSNILYITTILFDLVGVILAVIFIWLNMSGKISDLSERSASILKIAKKTVIFSFVSTLLYCLLTNNAEVEEVIAQTNKLFSIIAMTWMIVLAFVGIALIRNLASKSDYKKNVTDTLLRMGKLALISGVVGVVLAWFLA